MKHLNNNVMFSHVVVQLAHQLAELLGHPSPAIQQGWN